MERIPLKDNPTGQTLLLVTLALLAAGVVMVHSAVASVLEPGAWYCRVDVRHTIFAAAAVLVVLTCWRFDYTRLVRPGRFRAVPKALLVVSIVIAVLVFVPGIGHSVGGHHRWIRIGPRQYSIGFQPSELIKVALLIFLAAWLSGKPPAEVRDFRKTFLPAAGLMGLCAGLVVTQDFGTAALIGVTSAVTLLLAGVRVRHLVLLAAPAAAGFWLLVVRDPRRWARITAMLDPWSPTNPSAYQPRQSLMAILSGGWFGKGTGCGISKLGFLPEDSTDFIFSVVCEEWGFVGAMLLMALIAAWIWSARRAAVGAGCRFGRLLAGSLGAMIGIQAALHIAVVLVAAPPTGVGLPFISAGGTALVVMAAATALIVSVSARRGERFGLGPRGSEC